MYNKKIIIISSVFIALEIILGILIQFTHNNLHVALCYSSVVIACLFLLLFTSKKHATSVIYIITHIPAASAPVF